MKRNRVHRKLLAKSGAWLASIGMLPIRTQPTSRASSGPVDGCFSVLSAAFIT